MTSTVSAVQVRRSLNRSHQRKPLRVQITRRRTGKPAGAHQFVTQVRFGGAEAVVLPWERRAQAVEAHAGEAPAAHSAPATDLAAA
jgi:hypothetical protein